MKSSKSASPRNSAAPGRPLKAPGVEPAYPDPKGKEFAIRYAMNRFGGASGEIHVYNQDGNAVVKTLPVNKHQAYAYEVWANRGSSSSPASLPVAVFRSEALNDGIARSGGASNPSGANTVRAGESAVPAQQKGVISFDTFSLGSGITLLAAKLA